MLFIKPIKLYGDPNSQNKFDSADFISDYIKSFAGLDFGF